MSNYRSRRLLDAAANQSCKNCGRQDGTVVAAHSNWSEHGKGMSIKAHDAFVAELCGACHSWLDQGKGPDPTGRYEGTYEGKREMWRRAHDQTLLRWFREGVVR